jgi:hypothetical protein
MAFRYTNPVPRAGIMQLWQLLFDRVDPTGVSRVQTLLYCLP